MRAIVSLVAALLCIVVETAAEASEYAVGGSFGNLGYHFFPIGNEDPTLYRVSGSLSGNRSLNRLFKLGVRVDVQRLRDLGDRSRSATHWRFAVTPTLRLPVPHAEIGIVAELGPQLLHSRFADTRLGFGAGFGCEILGVFGANGEWGWKSATS